MKALDLCSPPPPPPPPPLPPRVMDVMSRTKRDRDRVMLMVLREGQGGRM